MATLISMPSEMHVEIAGHLDNQALCAFRQVSRELAANAHDTFIARFFRSRSHILTVHSIEILRQISESSFARHIQAVNFAPIRDIPGLPEMETGYLRKREQVDALSLTDWAPLVEIFKNLKQASAGSIVNIPQEAWLIDYSAGLSVAEARNQALESGAFGVATMFKNLDRMIGPYDFLLPDIDGVFAMVTQAMIEATHRPEHFALGLVVRGGEADIACIERFRQDVLSDLWQNLKSLSLNFEPGCSPETTSTFWDTLSTCANLTHFAIMSDSHFDFGEKLATALLNTNVRSVALSAYSASREDLWDAFLKPMLPRLLTLKITGMVVWETTWNELCGLLLEGDLSMVTLNYLSVGDTRVPFSDEATDWFFEAEGEHEAKELLTRLAKTGGHKARNQGE